MKRRLITTPSKRRMTAALIKLCRLAASRLPLGIEPAASPYGDHALLIQRYEDSKVIIVFGPGRSNLTVIGKNPARQILTVLLGHVVVSFPHKSIIDRLKRLMVLDQLARG
jgi:hypothetical protein